jgi:exonuclease III
MAKFLQLALWNANGLSQHMEELKTFTSTHNIDIVLISETHITEKSYLKPLVVVLL